MVRSSTEPLPDTVTIAWAMAHFGLDNAGMQRLRYHLRGQQVGREARAGGIGGVMYFYRLADIIAVLADDPLRRGTGQFGPDAHLYACRCGRWWLSAAHLDAHVARDHAGVMPVAACPAIVDESAYLAAVADGRARSPFNRAAFPRTEA